MTAQACHAAMAAVHQWGVPADNTIVVLDGGTSHGDLMAIMDRCVGWCAPSDDVLISYDEYIEFVDPDLGDEHTAFAIKPGCAPTWIKSLPLLFRDTR